MGFWPKTGMRIAYSMSKKGKESLGYGYVSLFFLCHIDRSGFD